MSNLVLEQELNEVVGGMSKTKKRLAIGFGVAGGIVAVFVVGIIIGAVVHLVRSSSKSPVPPVSPVSSDGLFITVQSEGEIGSFKDDTLYLNTNDTKKTVVVDGKTLNIIKLSCIMLNTGMFAEINGLNVYVSIDEHGHYGQYFISNPNCVDQYTKYDEAGIIKFVETTSWCSRPSKEFWNIESQEKLRSPDESEDNLY